MLNQNVKRRFSREFCGVAMLGALIVAGCREDKVVVSNTATAPSDNLKASAPAQVIAFEERAERSGIKFRWAPQKRPLNIVSTLGYGCAFFDYDNDGWQDILLVGAQTPALFRNTRDGQFENVTVRLGLGAFKGAWNGCAIGDYDGDGFADVLLTGFHSLALLKNQAAKGWTNVTVKVGLHPQNRFHTGSSAGFMDLDRNGTLDLVIGNYVKFGPQEKQNCESVPGTLDACGPIEYKPEFAELWRNDGQGRFFDVSRKSGFSATHGKALAVAFADFNNDNLTDIYVGNDGVPADLMLNQGNLRFRNVGKSSGTAYGMVGGRPVAAMGADWSDFDRDGRLDLVVSAFSDEPASLFRNLGSGAFENASEATQLAGVSMNSLEFGAKWLDFDNDSWPDLAMACGHVFDQAEQLNPLSPWRQPILLAHNQKDALSNTRQFVNIAPRLEKSLLKPIVGRGLATGDYDNDGRMDLLVVDAEGSPLLLHNLSVKKHHWITFDVKDQNGNPALGAQVVARAGNKVWVGQVSPSSSYLSSSDPRVHFGLGDTEILDSVVIEWPSGRKRTLNQARSDQIITVRSDKAALTATE